MRYGPRAGPVHESSTGPAPAGSCPGWHSRPLLRSSAVETGVRNHPRLRGTSTAGRQRDPRRRSRRFARTVPLRLLAHPEPTRDPSAPSPRISNGVPRLVSVFVYIDRGSHGGTPLGSVPARWPGPAKRQGPGGTKGCLDPQCVRSQRRSYQHRYELAWHRSQAVRLRCTSRARTPSQASCEELVARDTSVCSILIAAQRS